MKVLFISSWYPTYKNPLKGLFVKKHAHAIKSQNIEIEIITISIQPSSKFYEKKTYSFIDEALIKTHVIEINSLFYKFFYVNLFFQYRLLKKYYFNIIKANFEPLIIHSNILFPSAILGYWLSLKLKTPHIITEHWSKLDKFFKVSLYKYQGEKALNKAATITCVSSFLANNVNKYTTNKKIVIIPNVINQSLFYYIPKTTIINEIYFSCAAHWSLPKRPDLVFNALEKVSKTTTQKIYLNVIGSGPLIEELKIKEWNFTINYLGNLPSNEVSSVIQKSHFFIHASTIETFSVVIAEALATGTPVLASNVGAIPDLIHTTNGFLVENNTEAWALQINASIHKTDWNHQLISESAKKYSTHEVGNLFKNLYENII